MEVTRRVDILNGRPVSAGGPHEWLEGRILGSGLPLPRTEAERHAARDPRPSLEQLYAGRDDYLTRARAAARRLGSARVLLEEDLERVIDRATRHWDWVRAR